MAQNTFNAEMVYIEPFDHPTWGIRVGGFLVDKYECSHPSATPDNAQHGADPGTTVAACSVQGMPPWTGVGLIKAMKACNNRNGDSYTGFHLMTAHEWAVVAEWSRIKGTMPLGNNNSTNPPSDATDTDTYGVMDRSYPEFRSYTGTGPPSWSHNHGESGIYDLNGNVHEWVMGLMIQQTSGYPWILANLNTDLKGSPYGQSTAVAATSLTDSLKSWTTNEFATMTLWDSGLNSYTITSNTATTLTLASGTPAAGPYFITRSVSTDVTAGMVSGNAILTLQSSADLAPFCIPATSDATGSATYGNDGYWFNKSQLGGVWRGGGWGSGTKGGVYCLMAHQPYTYAGEYYLGFRCARSL